MSKISNYVENVFSSLPQNAEVLQMKGNIIDSMEEKYNEFLRAEKNENEAFGIVISEFGSIDEIKQELGIFEFASQETPKDNFFNAEVENEIPPIDPTLLAEYQAFRPKFNRAITTGVLLCLMGVFAPFFTREIIKTDVVGIVLFFIFILIAVALFISYGIQNEKFERFERQPLPYTPALEEEYRRFQPKFISAIVLGVGLLIVGLLAGYLFDEVWPNELLSGGLFLVCILIAVPLFTYFGMQSENFASVGHKINGNSNQKKNTLSDRISSVIMLSATAIFLVFGFVYNTWHPAWIVFVIGGILCGITEIVIDQHK